MLGLAHQARAPLGVGGQVGIDVGGWVAELLQNQVREPWVPSGVGCHGLGERGRAGRRRDPGRLSGGGYPGRHGRRELDPASLIAVAHEVPVLGGVRPAALALDLDQPQLLEHAGVLPAGPLVALGAPGQVLRGELPPPARIADDVEVDEELLLGRRERLVDGVLDELHADHAPRSPFLGLRHAAGDGLGHASKLMSAEQVWLGADYSSPAQQDTTIQVDAFALGVYTSAIRGSHD